MHPDDLIVAIERAFSGVRLANGIGLLEAEALDRCVSEKLRDKARAGDIRNDWTLLSDDVLSEHGSAMAFMDQAGLKFALPAYMRFAVRHWRTSDSACVDHVIYTLARDEDWSFLSKEQNIVVANFLEYMVLEAGGRVDSEQASFAYEKCWAKYGTGK